MATPRNTVEIQKAEGDSEPIHIVEVVVIARVAIGAPSKRSAAHMARKLFGAGERVQAVTGDGIPFSVRIP